MSLPSDKPRLVTSHRKFPAMSNTQSVSSIPLTSSPALIPQQTTVGRWTLTRLISKGSLTALYEARPENVSLDRPADYVAKVLHPEHQNDELAVSLLRSEAHVGSHVTHPNLISILAAQIDEAPYYLIMPYLQGESVRTQLDVGTLPVLPQTFWIARQVAEALNAMHSAGWMHADIKPDNIMVSSQGHATLIDLGFSCRLDSIGAVTDRPFLGTMYYVAPELFITSRMPDARSDIYSLGATLYEMLTGRPPFQCESSDELAIAHLRQVPTNPRSLVPQIPSDVSQLLLQMLSKEPLRRPQTATELIQKFIALEIETFGNWELSL